MTEFDAGASRRKIIDCPDCHALPAPGNDCDGPGTDKETWHTRDCPAWIVYLIMLEDDIRTAKEDRAREQEAFPAAHQRLKDAVAALPGDTSAAPFVAALSALVQVQADRVDAFVTMRDFAAILDKHFPHRSDASDS